MEARQPSIPIRVIQSSLQTPIRSAFTALGLAVLVAAVTWIAHPIAGGVLAGVLFFALSCVPKVPPARPREGSNGRNGLNGSTLDQVLFDQVPCYLTIQDRDLNIMRHNDLFDRDFGNGIGQKCYKMYKDRDEACAYCPVVLTFEDGETHTKEETVTDKEGSWTRLLVYTTPVKDADGKIVGVMEMSTNITRMKKLQTEIEASRREYQTLFDRVPCYISIQNRDLEIVRTNALFSQEFGDAIGKRCFEVLKHAGDECETCPARATWLDGKIRSCEATVIKKDGSTARLIVYSSPLYDDQGEISAVMEMSTDITEVKKLQRELTFMGKTVAYMAHRIKNILMGLEGGIFVVNTGMDDKDDAMIQQGWGMIQRNVSNVSRIVKDLLYCSKDRELHFDRIDPSSVVHAVHDLFSGRAQKEGIELQLECPESLDLGWFDGEALDNMLTNLVSNAFDACLTDPTEGKDRHFITLRAVNDDSGKLICEVEDNGAGIPGNMGERVFDDFFSTKGREGTGLGLLVAEKVVEAHGGSLTFRSSEGSGTRFRAVFPKGGAQNIETSSVPELA